MHERNNIQRIDINARLNFRQQEENHLMKNIIYNELLIIVYNVDVGVVEVGEEGKRKQLKVDFVCNLGVIHFLKINNTLNKKAKKYQIRLVH